MNHSQWLCPLIGIVGAGVTLAVFGLTWLSAVGIAFLIACPVLMLWAMRKL